MYQVEFDASVRKGNSYLGFILNRDFGDILHKDIILLENENSSIRAEIFAALFGIKYCVDNNIKELKVFGDCSEAIRYLIQIRNNTFRHKTILSKDERRYIYNILKKFIDIKFYHLPRELNRITHSLVEDGNFNESKSWRRMFQDFPL